jgi:shikimate dehydrogenase
MPAPHAGVLGRPIAHSLSPVLHRAAYTALGLNWTYDAIDCGVGELPGVLSKRADWAGFSATMPLKHALLDVAAEVRATAEIVGAANTLLPGPKGWIADNTDVAGISGALAEHDLRPSSVTVLGAGGTAQAVIVAVHDLGLDECAVLVRDASRTAQTREAAGRAAVALDVGSLDSGTAALQADLVISTLPGGAADPIALRRWSSGQAVLDVVYSPWPTKLAASAAAAGATVVSGALMLLHQAAAQVELMTGQPAPVDAMRAALGAAMVRPIR